MIDLFAKRVDSFKKMNNLAVIITNEQIEELRAIFVEAEFNSRIELIKGYHEAGKLLSEVKGANLQELARQIGRSERTLYYAAKLYERYPDLNLLPEGKNISMNKMITKYLTIKEAKEHEHKPITICSGCKERLDR